MWDTVRLFVMVKDMEEYLERLATLLKQALRVCIRSGHEG